MKYTISKKVLLLIFFCCSLAANAETIKTDVLVIGGTVGGTAAAIQSARSKLKTLLVEAGPQLGSWAMNKQQVTISGNKNLPAGIWGEFRRKVNQFYSKTNGYDSTAIKALTFEPYTGSAILKKITDTVKNLTVRLNATWTDVKKDGTGWNIIIKQGQEQVTVKVRLLIDATQNGDVARSLALLSQSDPGHIDGLVKLTSDDIVHPYNELTNLYRTSIAVCEPDRSANRTLPPFSIPLGALIAKNADNFIVAGTAISLDPQLSEAIADPAVQFSIGQGAGVIAAYCAFYKTSTKSLSVKSVRAIQGELLDFKGYLMPFEDIATSDPYIRAIQQVGATGLLEGRMVQNIKTKEISISFLPDTLVRTAEIKQGLNELYTRAFLWFNREKPVTYFTVGNLLSFISEITLRDPKTFQLDMQKQWQPVFKFNTVFDLKNPLTRREFAVLANKFLNPFARYVEITGRLVN